MFHNDPSRWIQTSIFDIPIARPVVSCFVKITKCQTLKTIIYKNVPHEANIQKWFRGHIEIGTSINLTKYKYSHEGGVSFCISFHLALNYIVSVSFARAGELFLYSSRSL